MGRGGYAAYEEVEAEGGAATAWHTRIPSAAQKRGGGGERRREEKRHMWAVGVRNKWRVCSMTALHVRVMHVRHVRDVWHAMGAETKDTFLPNIDDRIGSQVFVQRTSATWLDPTRAAPASSRRRAMHNMVGSQANGEEGIF